VSVGKGGSDFLKLSPLLDEFTQDALLWCLFNFQANLEQRLEELLSKLSIHLGLLLLNRQTVPLVVQLVPQAVVPLNHAEVDAGNLLGDVLFNGIKEFGETFGYFLEAVSGQFDTGYTPWQTNIRFECELHRIVDVKHRKPSVPV